MDAQWLSREKWRFWNKIRGKCYYLNTRVDDTPQKIADRPGVLQPSGICLYTTKKYFILENPMGWDILYISDNVDKFNEISKDAWGGEKGCLRNLSCWDVLEEMQREGGTDYKLDVYPLYYYIRLSK